MTESDSLPATGSRKPKFFYGYVIVIVGFCIQMVIFGIHSSVGIYYNSFIIEFGWSRATMTAASSIASVMIGVSAIVAGRFSDRVGPRIVMIVCAVLFGIGFLLMSTVNSLWQLYLFFGVCSGIGVSGADVMPLSTVARWFVKKRGMMSGILKVGTGVGQMTIPLLATSLILAYGWRQSFIYLGVIGLIVLIVVAQFLKRDPAEKGLLPYGAEADEGSEGSREEYGLSLKEALQTGRFRMYCAICVLFYFLMQIIMAHTVLNAIGLGISALSAATLLSTIGGASIGGRLTMGVILDKIGSRLSLIICFIILVLSMVWLQTATELWSLYVFAGMYGFAHGGFFALFSPLVAELFGLKAHGSILGAVIFSGAAGGAAGPVLAGWIFDVTQSYQIAFLLCLALSVAALILSVLLKRANAGKGADFVIG